MKNLLLITLCLGSALWAQDSMTIYEVDGVTQTNRPTTFGRVFVKGEITSGNCPRPVIGGTPVATGSWQADIKNAWGDGSVKFAIVSFKATISASSNIAVTFQNGTCNNAGFLTQAGMTGFNSGNWNAQMVFTPQAASASAAAVTTDFKTILGVNDPGADTFGDCKNDYWLQGPVVTAVIVQDCTSSSPYDFGWHWNGTNMASDGVNPSYTGNSIFASIHPQAILYFYPSINAVQVHFVWELGTYTRIEDQLADVVLKTGSTPTAVWTRTGGRILNDVTVTSSSNIITSASANFTGTDKGLPINLGTSYESHIIASITNSTTAVLSDLANHAGTNQAAYIDLQIDRSRHKKTFWSGTAPGHIRIGHNFAYLISTLAIPNYDSGVTVDPTINYRNSSFATASQWSYLYWAGNTDRGEPGGTDQYSAALEDYASNDEGAPLQREELYYMYNMDSGCGAADSFCAMAWQMLTGNTADGDQSTHAGIDTAATTQYDSVGGGGQWGNLGNVGFHVREGRTAASGAQSAGTNFFYCSGFADKNAASDSTTCSGSGATNVALGRPHSRHAHSSEQIGTVLSGAATSGTVGSSPGGWVGYSLCDHWLDYATTAYMLTGDYYELEEIEFSASTCISGHSAVYSANSEMGAGFFGFVNSANILREQAWGIQAIGRAAFYVPDADAPTQNYYKAMLDSNLEVMEGANGVTGTTLTPSSTNPTGTNYNFAAANRWDWGRLSYMSRCFTSGTTCATIVAPSLLYFVVPGGAIANGTTCTTGMGGNPVANLAGRVDPTVASGYSQEWFQSYYAIALGELREMGFSEAQGMNNLVQQHILQEVLDSTSNAYMFGAFINGSKDATLGNGNCNGTAGANTDPFIQTWAQELLAYGGGSSGGDQTGTVNTQNAASGACAGNCVILATGTSFQTAGWQNTPVLIPFTIGGTAYNNGVNYGISSVQTSSLLTLSTPPGTQTGVAYAIWIANQNSFNEVYPAYPNTMCGDHGYSTTGRAAASFLQEWNASSTDANCPTGICKAAAAWTWVSAEVPYFGNSPAHSLSCPTLYSTSPVEEQIKFALAPRSATTLGTQLAPVSRWTAGATIQ